MVELQILSRVLEDKSFALLTQNGITDEYFSTYAAEYSFIKEHLTKYGNVPDKVTFSAKFTDFTFVEVTEPDKYLVDTLNEERLFALMAPVVNKLAEIVRTDSRAAVEYLQSQLPSLAATRSTVGIDIVAKARARFEEWEQRKQTPETFCIPTGFDELDAVTGGWQCGEEFAVLFARTGQGKSWVLLKTLENAWRLGKRVGIMEPEMSANKTGYRFDTLSSNISNMALLRGQEVPEYSTYVQNLEKNSTPFIVTNPREFGRKITVSKLRTFAVANKLDILGIDGISYLTDERKQRQDNRTTGLTNISEDLMDLSNELHIPIIIVCQSNREGAKDDDAPGLENIRDSDGIAYNASVIIAVKQKGPGIELAVRKNRNGQSGDKLTYLWDIDSGIFKYIPNDEYANEPPERVERVSREFNDGTGVF